MAGWSNIGSNSSSITAYSLEGGGRQTERDRDRQKETETDRDKVLWFRLPYESLCLGNRRYLSISLRAFTEAPLLFCTLKLSFILCDKRQWVESQLQRSLWPLFTSPNSQEGPPRRETTAKTHTQQKRSCRCANWKLYSQPECPILLYSSASFIFLSDQISANKDLGEIGRLFSEAWRLVVVVVWEKNN